MLYILHCKIIIFIKQLVDSLEQNIGCWRQAYIQPTAWLYQVSGRTEMLCLLWVLWGSMHMLKTSENYMGELGWLSCIGVLGWFKWVGVLGWAFPALCANLFILRLGVLSFIKSCWSPPRTKTPWSTKVGPYIGSSAMTLPAINNT